VWHVPLLKRTINFSLHNCRPIGWSIEARVMVVQYQWRQDILHVRDKGLAVWELSPRWLSFLMWNKWTVSFWTIFFSMVANQTLTATANVSERQRGAIFLFWRYGDHIYCYRRDPTEYPKLQCGSFSSSKGDKVGHNPRAFFRKEPRSRCYGRTAA
jgi:hypothetical protein